jgi:hypothetical protein
MTIEIYHMAVSVIVHVPGQRVVGGSMLHRLNSLRLLETDGGRCGHAVCDATWDIRSERPRGVNSGLMR